MNKIPKAIWEGTFTIFGVTLQCSILDDEKHSRVIDSEDVVRLFEVIGSDSCPDEPGDEFTECVKWLKT